MLNLSVGVLIARCTFVRTNPQKLICLNSDSGAQKLATRFLKMYFMEENKAKRGWGRGRRKPKVNRTENIYIRCTVEEKQAIRELASEYGMEVSSFIRGKILKKEASLINAVQFLAMYREGVWELKKIGNNINQLARYANYAEKSGQFPPALFEELNKHLQDFIRSQREFADLDRKILRG